MIYINDLSLIEEIIDEKLKIDMPESFNNKSFDYEKYKKLTTLCLRVQENGDYNFYRKPIKLNYCEEDIYNCYSPIYEKLFLEDIILKIKMNKEIEINSEKIK